MNKFDVRVGEFVLSDYRCICKKNKLKYLYKIVRKDVKMTKRINVLKIRIVGICTKCQFTRDIDDGIVVPIKIGIFIEKFL